MNGKLVKFAVRCIGVVGYVTQYACVAHCALEYVGDFVVCSGPSMEPTIVSSDILFTEHISPRLQLVKKGDIVISVSPTNPQINICKRVAGTAGDKIHVGLFNQVVPRGHVWLEGDNHANSSDSRQFGPVPEGLIRGRAICKVWPPTHIQMLTH